MKSIPLMLMLILGAAASSPAAAGLDDFLGQLGVDVAAESLPAAPVPGFLEVTRGTRVLYVSTDGRLVINGDILSLANETNLTEMRRGEIRRELLQEIPDDARLVVPASAPAVTRIVVFTDTNCPYCSRLHRQREELSELGIEIHYLFYPRSGLTGASFDQAVAVWCSKDRLAALERALRGATLPRADCAHPVSRHFELARKLDLKGTPAIIAPDGTVRYSLHSPEDILDIVPQR